MLCRADHAKDLRRLSRRRDRGRQSLAVVIRCCACWKQRRARFRSALLDRRRHRGAAVDRQPLLLAMGFGSLIVFFVVIVAVCVGIGVPIAFAFGIATMSYLGLTTTMPLSIVINRMDDGISNLLLLSVPMFVFLGLLMEMTGIARVMVEFLAALVGHVRGGLSYVLLGAMYLVCGISGSKAADMAAVAPVLFPEMRRRGSHPGELAVAAGDVERDVGDDPAEPGADHDRLGDRPIDRRAVHRRASAGIGRGARTGRGVLVAFAQMDTGGGERAPRREMLRTFVIAVPGLTLPFVIRSAVIDGIATATEVSTVGVVYTAVLGLLVYRQFDWRRIYPILVETLSLTGAVMMIIGTATAMAWALTQSGFSLWLVATMATVPGGSCGFLSITIGRLHRARQRAGGDTGDRAVRAAAVPGRQGDGRARGALRAGGDPGDGDRALRATVRRRVLWRMRDRAGVAG